MNNSGPGICPARFVLVSSRHMGDWDQVNMETEPIEPEGLNLHEAIRNVNSLRELHEAILNSKGCIHPELGQFTPEAIVQRIKIVFNETHKDPNTFEKNLEKYLSFDRILKDTANRLIREALRIKSAD